MRLQGVFDLPHRKKCTLKNCAALWDSMKGRPKHSSRESLWSMQGNSTRRNTDGDLRPKKVRLSSVESPDGWGKLVLAIARKPIAEWFKE